MSREDSPGWQEPPSQLIAGLGEDFEPVKVELKEPLQIGNSQSGTFSGSLCNVRLYDRALAKTEVAAFFKEQRLKSRLQ